MKTQLANAAKVTGLLLLVVVPGGSLVLLAQALFRLHRRPLALAPSAG